MSQPKRRKVARFPQRRAEEGRGAAPTPAPASADYFQLQPAKLPGRLQDLSALTGPGVRGFPGVDPAQALLAETLVRSRVRGPLLDLSAQGGLLGRLPGTELRAVEGSAAALRALRAGGYEAHAAAVGDSLTGVWDGRPGAVALILAGDRGNAYAQAQVAWAHACTPPGVTLYLAGDRDKGFDRYLRAAAGAFGTGEVIARDGGMRVAALTRRPGPPPPFPPDESYEAFGLRVIGRPGVFSAGRADQATTLLLETLIARGLAPTLADQPVLDLGCGAGLIGAWAAAQGAAVTLLDADLQSVRSAQATLEANGLSGEALHSDVDSALGEQTYSLVLSNPPFHVGRGVILDVAREFIAAAGRRLRPGGQLVLVANAPLPYEEPMGALGTVEELARTTGFKVLAVRRLGPG